MTEDVNKFERGLALNCAADFLGFDETTRRAMIHMETLIATLGRFEFTWDDIPERFSLESAVGETTLKALCTIDPGLELVVRAQSDPDLRGGLLAKYVQCIEVSMPGETMTLEQTLQALRSRDAD